MFEKGKESEKLAAKYLMKVGYQIVATNYYTRFGEIDIIAIDPVTRNLTFIEVKMRTSDRFGAAALNLTQSKKKKIKLSAHVFMQSHKDYMVQTSGIRFDLIALQVTEASIKCTHYKNVE